MSKESKEKEVKEKPKANAYKLSAKIMNEGGYVQEIDGRMFVIDYDRDYEMKRISRFATLCELEQDPITGKKIPKQIKPEVITLTDLTDVQLKSLAYAKVIDLTPAQEKDFREKFYPKAVN